MPQRASTHAFPRAFTLAFTLIELLVVIGVISILIAILIPVATRVRESARRTTCASQLRQIGAGLHRYFNEFHCLPVRDQGLEFNNPHVFRFQNNPGDVSEAMLKYCGPKSIFYCPENNEDRTAGTWWPYRTGTIASTYQFPFWLTPDAWVITYPDYRRLTIERVLAADLLATSDGVSNVIEYNHRMTKSGAPIGMNMLFGDGHVTWNDSSRGWVLYGWYGAVVYWHYAQF